MAGFSDTKLDSIVIKDVENMSTLAPTEASFKSFKVSNSDDQARGEFRTEYYADGIVASNVIAYNYLSGSPTYAVLGVGVNSSGTQFLISSKDISSNIANLGFPSGKTQSFNIGASGTGYVAPANGWFNLNIQIYGNNTWLCMIVGGIKVFQWCSSNEQEAGLCVPIRKGDTCYIHYNTSIALQSWNYGLLFIYSQADS